MAIFNKQGPFSQNFTQTPKKFCKTKKFSGKKLPLKTPIPSSKTQNLTKAPFFLGHPVDSKLRTKRLLLNNVTEGMLDRQKYN